MLVHPLTIAASRLSTVQQLAFSPTVERPSTWLLSALSVTFASQCT
jgi:hypothetical protein